MKIYVTMVTAMFLVGMAISFNSMTAYAQGYVMQEKGKVIKQTFK